MIRTYVAEHGGTVLVSTPTRRQKRMRTRLMALAVITATAASAGVVQAFSDHAALQRAYASNTWAP